MRPGLYFPQFAFLGIAFILAIVALVGDGLMLARPDKAISLMKEGMARVSATSRENTRAGMRIEDYRQWQRLLYVAVVHLAITVVYLIARIYATARSPRSFFARDTLLLSILAAAGTGISVPLLLQQEWLNTERWQYLVLSKADFGVGKCMDPKDDCAYSAFGSICGAIVPLLLLATVLFVSIESHSLVADTRDMAIRETARRAVEADTIAPFPSVPSMPSTQSHSDDGMGAPLISGTASSAYTAGSKYTAGSNAKTGEPEAGTSSSGYQYHKARLANPAYVYPSSPASTARSPTKFGVAHTTQAPAAWSYNGHPVSGWSYTSQSNNTDMSERQESLLPPSYPVSDSQSTLRPSDSRSNANNSNPNLLLRHSGGASTTLGAHGGARPASRVSTVSNFEWPDWVVAASSSGNGSSSSSTGGSTSRPAVSKF